MIFLSTLILLLIYSSTSIVVARAILEVWIKNTPSLILLSLAAGLVISCGQIDISSGALLTFLGMAMAVWMNCTIPGNKCYISALNTFFLYFRLILS
jgi:ribose/xylose/arabinose/galactoside ABC-type transport system permease subunit